MDQIIKKLMTIYSAFKLSDSKAPNLEIWGISGTPSLPLHPVRLWPGVVAPERVLSQIKQTVRTKWLILNCDCYIAILEAIELCTKKIRLKICSQIIYIYIYIYIYMYIYIYIYWRHFFVNTNFIKHNRHLLYTYFLLDPFGFPYCFYRIRRELIYVLFIVVCIPSIWSKVGQKVLGIHTTMNNT